MTSLPIVTLLLPGLSLLIGLAVYWDSVRIGRNQGNAALVGFIVGGLFLTGSIPGLVALAIAEESAPQGFPTAIRVIPGFAALVVYLSFRRLGRN